MTLDETNLSRALRDLAATVPDNPAPLSHVHHIARRRHRRQRAIGAGALAATMAAAVVGAEALASTGRRPPRSQTASAGPATTLPACPPGAAPAATSGPPAIGQQFSGGGIVSSPGTATSVTVDVDGGPMSGARITLTIGPSSAVYESDPSAASGEKAVTGDQLHTGQSVKFSATRTATATYLADDLHAAGPSAGMVTKPSIGGPPAPPAIGEAFKVGGTVVSSTSNTVTVDVTAGNLKGVVTFTLQCTPGVALAAGKDVEIVGQRTGASTYQVSTLQVRTP